MKPRRAQLAAIAQLIDENKLRVLLAEVLPLPRAREGFVHGAGSRRPGKIVLQVARQSGVVAA